MVYNPTKLIWRYPRTILFSLTCLVLIGASAGLVGYAYHHWHAAQAALKEGRLADANRSLDVCLWFWPRSVPVHLLRTRAARLKGDFGDAETLLNHCLELGTESREDIQIEFLLIRVQTGEADSVEQDLMAFVENNHPESEMILDTLAEAYLTNHRYRAGVYYLDRWIEKFPQTPRPYFWRGWVAERLTDEKAALADYGKAVELAPHHINFRLRLAEYLLERNNVPEAFSHLQVLKELAPERGEVLMLLGYCYLTGGEGRKARPLLEAALKKLPEDPALLTRLARLEKQEGRYPEGEKLLRRLLKLEPYDLEAEFQLSECLRLQYRKDEAAAMLRQYNKHYVLVKRINDVLKEETEKESNDPTGPYEAGIRLMEIGQDHVGEYWLYEALKRAPWHQPSHKALASYYEKKGEPDKAEAHRRWLSDPVSQTSPR